MYSFNLSEAQTPTDVTEMGWTPLHMAAACSSDPAVIKALLDNGANPRALTSTWMTPYEIAAKRGASEEILRAAASVKLPLRRDHDLGFTFTQCFVRVAIAPVRRSVYLAVSLLHLIQ